MKNIKLGLISMATFEAIKPPYNLSEPTVEENLQLALEILDVAGKNQLDIAVLPETFAFSGINAQKLKNLAENYPDKNLIQVSNKAKEYNMNIVAGFYTILDGKLRNISVYINREGKVTGLYIKKYTTDGEINVGVIPGTSSLENVFDTEFGKIGLAICFDINWDSIWKKFEEKNTDLIFWISAYEGGLPLQSRALLHGIPIVTSVMSYHSKLIDISGEILGSTSRWNRLKIIDFNLDRGIFHVDNQYDKIMYLQKKYGNQIDITSFTQEHLFVLESKSKNFSIKDLALKENLVNYKSYISDCTQLVNESAQ